MRELDARGLLPPVAFWLYNVESHRWRLTFAEKDINVKGARAEYGRMRDVLQEIPEPEDEDDYLMTLDDITLVDESAPIVKGLRKVMQPGSKRAVRLTNYYVDGAYIDDAYVYHAR